MYHSVLKYEDHLRMFTTNDSYVEGQTGKVQQYVQHRRTVRVPLYMPVPDMLPTKSLGTRTRMDEPVRVAAVGNAPVPATYV